MEIKSHYIWSDQNSEAKNVIKTPLCLSRVPCPLIGILKRLLEGKNVTINTPYIDNLYGNRPFQKIVSHMHLKCFKRCVYMCG